MRCTSVFVVSCLAGLFSGCSYNSHFDDSSYRPLGKVNPVNPRQPVTPVKPAEPAAPPRYTADGYDADALTSLRYGHAVTIAKILQTAKIHCAPRPLFTGAETAEMPEFSQCRYQFPRHCGSHSFTLLEGPDQVALVYHDHQNHRSIVDQISDRHYARPGLWDLSDKVSVTSAFPEQQLAQQFLGNQWREWVVDMNDSDRAFFGTTYAKAVNEVQACF